MNKKEHSPTKGRRQAPPCANHNAGNNSSSSSSSTSQRQRLQVILPVLVLVVCLSNLYLGSMHALHPTSGSTTSHGVNNLPLPPRHVLQPPSVKEEDLPALPELDPEPQPQQSKDKQKDTTVHFAGLGDMPPLSDIVHGRDVIGNVSWLLDFAIVGFPKCGTTSIMRHLQSHAAVAIHKDERCDLSYNNQGYLARALYDDFPHDVSLQRGLKCPLELENNILGMPNYRKFFPHTKFIIGGELDVIIMRRACGVFCCCCRTNS